MLSDILNLREPTESDLDEQILISNGESNAMQRAMMVNDRPEVLDESPCPELQNPLFDKLI